MNKRFHTMTCPELFEQRLFEFPLYQYRSRAADKGRVILADGFYVLMLRNRPEWLKVGVLDSAHRVMFTQLLQELVHGRLIAHDCSV